MSEHIPFNPFLKQSKLRQIFESAPADAINLGLGQPGEDTPAFIREAASRVALEKPMGYTLNAGLIPLREKIGHLLDVQPSEICVTSGVQEGLFSLFQVLLDANHRVLLPDPGFLTYPALSRLRGAVPQFYSLKASDGFSFQADNVLRAIEPDTTAVLVNHPSNPMGTVVKEVEYEKLIRGLEQFKRPIWLISDEVYHGMEFLGGSSSLLAFREKYPWIVVFRGASKTHHMTGWRLGWAVLPPEIITKMIASHQYVCTCASALTQWTFHEIIGSNEEKEWLNTQRALYKEKRDIVRLQLGGLRTLAGGEGAFYFLMKLLEDDLKKESTDEKWVLRAMKEARVTTTPGSAFGKESSGWIRISFGPRKAQLKEGLERLVNFLQA